MSYADNYLALTDEQAAKLTKDYFKLEADRAKIKKKYVQENAEGRG